MSSPRSSYIGMKQGTKNNAGCLGLNWLYTKYYRLTTNWHRVPIMTREFIRMTGSLRGRAKSSRPRRQVKNARRRGFRHVENVFGRQRSHRALQPAAIERVIGIHSFMQNKPNLRDAQMNVSLVITREYKNKSDWKLGENKANTKPIKANLLDSQMTVSSVKTTNYEQITMNNANKKQTQSNPKRIYP